MRGYMYAYGYNQPAKARETIDLAGLTNLPCNNCSSCSVTCPSSFDVKLKVTDIARLKTVPREFLMG